MKSYYEILEQKATNSNVLLKDAFILAGVPSSTYYRVKYGQDMRHSTALKIYEKLRALQTTNTSDR